MAAVSGMGVIRTPMCVLSKEAGYLAINITETVKARYSGFNQAEILTERGQELLEKLKRTCTGPGTPRPKEPPVKGSEILLDKWELDPYIEKYFKQDETGQEKYKGPVLVINGEKEPPPTLANDIEAAKRMCDQGVDVQLIIVPDADHFTLPVDSINEQMEWISDRFAGREIPSNCENIFK